MQVLEILIAIVVISFVAIVFGNRIYKRLTNKPIDECAYCHKSTKKLLKEYHKKYGKSF